MKILGDAIIEVVRACALALTDGELVSVLATIGSEVQPDHNRALRSFDWLETLDWRTFS